MPLASAGTTWNAWPKATLQVNVSAGGRNGPTEPPTNTDRGGATRYTDGAASPQMMARPRSLRAKRFQRPRILHPYCLVPLPKHAPKPARRKLKPPIHSTKHSPSRTRTKCPQPAARTTKPQESDVLALSPASGACCSAFLHTGNTTLFGPCRQHTFPYSRPTACRSGPNSGAYLVLIIGFHLHASSGPVLVHFSVLLRLRCSVLHAGSACMLCLIWIPKFRISGPEAQAYDH